MNKNCSKLSQASATAQQLLTMGKDIKIYLETDPTYNLKYNKFLILCTLEMETI
jgi:hypothetical protein